MDFMEKPIVSAHVKQIGSLYLNATPMALHCTKLIAQEKPNQRAK